MSCSMDGEFASAPRVPKLNDHPYEQIRRISVEGYDTSLPAYDVAFALREHFASCGEILHSDIQPRVGSGLLNRYALVYLLGEGAVKKALELSGSDMGGRMIFTKAYPMHLTLADEIHINQLYCGCGISRICVEGYDTSLPDHIIIPALIDHFACCGEVVHADIFSRFAFIYIWGDGAKEKALLLSGSNMGGCIVVTKDYPSGLDLAPMKAPSSRHISSIRRIYVEGYDTSLPAYVVAIYLREHFASCGEILHIDIPTDVGSGLLNRFGFIYLRGEGAVEKAVGLGGSLVTKAYPFLETHLDLDLHAMNAPASGRRDSIRRICVEGYNTSLPAHHVNIALLRHFGPCGDILHIYIPTDVGSGLLNRFGFMYVRGEEAEKKMLRLSGSDMGGGRIVDAMAYPFRETDLNIALAPTEVYSSSSIRRVYVEGYDTSLPAYDVNRSLREHFASCGEVVHVYTPTEADSVEKLNRYGFIYVRGEGAEEKALGLSGSDMGGRIVVTKAYPFHETYLDLELAPMIAAETRQQHVMGVTGYDTSLSKEYVTSMLIEHFSSCGPVESVHVGQGSSVGSINSKAILYVELGDATEKALQLSGREVRGLNIVVTRVRPPLKPGSFAWVRCNPPRPGFSNPCTGLGSSKLNVHRAEIGLGSKLNVYRAEE